MALPVSVGGTITIATVAPATAALGGTGVGQILAQSFKGLSAINSTIIYLRKLGTPTDNVFVEIRSGSQTGTLLGTSDNVVGSGIPTTETATTWNFSTPVTGLDSSTTYWAVIKRSGALNSSNQWLISVDTAAPYADGTQSDFNGTVWTDRANDIRMSITQLGISTAVAPVGPFKVAAGNYLAGSATFSTMALATAGTAAGFFGGSTAPENGVAQTFTVPSNMSLRQVGLKINRNSIAIASDNFICELRNASPTGTLFATASVSASTVGTTSNPTVETLFQFPSGTALTTGNTYCIVAYRATPSGEPWEVWRSSTDAYAGGTAWKFTGSAWTTVPAGDMYMSFWGENTLANDAYYFFGRDGTTATTLRTFKAGDPSSSAANIDTGAGTTNSHAFGFSSSQKAAQSFLTSTAFSLSKITVSLFKSGAPTDNLLVDIFAADGSGFPTGSSLGQTSLAASSITTTAADYNFTFAPIALSASTKYCVVFSRSGAFDSVNYCRVAGSAASTYPDGLGLHFNGTTWVAMPGTVADVRLIVDTGTWASIATKTGFTTAILYLAGWQSGNTIHLLVNDGTASTLQATKYVSYDALTDTFLTTTETVSAAASVTGATNVGNFNCSIVVRANGDVIAFYNGVSTKTSGTSYSRMYYSRRTGVGAWTAAVQVDANAANNSNSPSAVLGSSGRVHFICFNNSSGLTQRALLSGNTLAAATSSATMSSAGDAVSYDRSGVTKVVVTTFTTVNIIARFDSSDTPAISTSSQAILSHGQPIRIGADTETGDVTLVYRLSADSDLYVQKSTDNGATWGTSVSFFAGTVVSGDTAASRSSSGSMYQRGSNMVVGYVVNDNATWKYNEYLVRQVGASGTGTLAADVAAASGTGDVTSPPATGTGTLTAQSATTVAPGKSEWIGTGALTAIETLSRTNLITQSQTFDNAAWVRFGTNIQPNIAFSPPFDFTVTAEILETANATNEAHRIHQTTDVVIGSPYTFSVYAKTSITSWLQLFYEGVAQNYNLAAGTLGNSINGGGTATITSVGNGWYRCTLSMIVNNTQVYPNIVLIDSDVAQLIPSFSNASCAITIWGAQFEAGSVATAYIPTTTTAVSDPKGVGNVRWNATGALSASTTRTNLLPYSQAFDTSWSKSGSVVIAANAVSAPDGSMTAEVVADTATLEHHIIYPGVFPTGLNGKPISFSVYAQANSLTWLQLFHNGAPPGTQNFNLSNGTLGGSTGSLTPAIQYVGSGWYRCSISFTSLAEAPPLYIALKATDEVGLATYLGTGKSLYLWGAQQELSLTPTTYIPTGATAVTVTDGASLSATGTVVTPPATGTGILNTNVAALVSSGTGASIGVGTRIAAADIVITGSYAGATNFGDAAHPNSGQGFIATANLITKLQIIMYVTPNIPSDGAVAKIFTVDASHNPVVQVGVTSNVVPGKGFPISAAAAVDFVFPTPVPVVNGTEYFIVLERTGALNSTFRYYHSVANDGYGGTNLCVRQFDGASWSQFIGGAYDAFVTITQVDATGVQSPSSVMTSAGISQATGIGTLTALGGTGATNLALQSETLNVAPWGLNAATITANAFAAPNSSNTAERLVDDATNGVHYVYQFTIPVTSGVPYTYSVYAKAETLSWFQLYVGAAWANFNVATGTTGYTGGLSATSIIAVGNGWYRCSITFTKVSGTTNDIALVLSNSDINGFPTYTGTGSGSLLLWGMQVELGSTPTAYIPTTTVPVTLPSVVVGSGTVASPAITGTGTLVVENVTGVINFILQSETLDVSPWAINGISITANAALSPVGTVISPVGSPTAELITDTTENTPHCVYQLVSFPFINKLVTFSIYAKAGTLSWLQIYAGNGWGNFNLSTGTLGNSNALTAREITPVGDGWYRCSVTLFAGGSTQINYVLGNSDLGAFGSYTGTGTGTLYLFGAQAEKYNVTPTTYITTTTAPNSVLAYSISGSTGTAGGTSDLIIQGATDPNVLGTGSIGQTFIATGTSISKVKLYLDHSGSSAGDVLVKLTTVTAGHMPLTEIGSASVILSSVPATKTLVEFTFSSPVAVTSGTEYALTVTRTAAQVDGSDLLHFYLSSASIYAGGQFVYNGGSWISVGPYDIDCVISFVALGGLLSSSSTLAGTGTVPPVTGTGTLVAAFPSSVTNLALQSETLNVSPRWSLNAATITANVATLAPNGTATAEQLTDDTSLQNHYVYQLAILTTAGLPYTFSVYAKAGTLSWLQVYSSNALGQANFNLTTGVIGNTTAGITPQMTAVGGGWYRCSITHTATGADTNLIFLLSTTDTTFLSSYTGDGTGSILLWGVQAELGTTPTAYIPTTTAAVTATASPLYGSGTVVTPPATGTGALVATPVGVTNLFLQSQTLNVAPWSIGGTTLGTITVDAIAAPDGTTTAEMVTDAAAANFHGVGQSVPLVGGTSYSLSVYAKAGTMSWLQLATGLGPKTANFNIASGTTGKVSSGVTSQITNAGNGWYRCSMFFTPAATFPDALYLYLAPNDITGVAFYTGSGTGTIYLWGAQLQLGSATTEYIPTTSTTDTRTYTLVSNGISGSTGSGAGGAGADIVITGGLAGNLPLGTTGNQKVGQGFIAAGTSITKVQFKGLYVSGTIPTDEVQVKIFTVDASHNPLTQVGVTSNVVPASSLNTTPSVVDFTFASAVPVSEGVEYVFVLERTGAINTTAPYYINLVSSSYGGSTLCYRQYNGTTWSAAFGGAYDIDCVVSHGAVVGGLLSSSSTIVGTGAGVAPEATGTGTLSAQSSTLSSAGISQSRSTSAVLNSQNSTLAGVALSTSLSTVAALVAPNRTMAGAAVSTSLGTATIIAPNRTMVGTGVGASTGTGALVPSVSTINGSVASLRAVISWVRLTATRVTITVSSGPLAVVEASDTPSFVGTVVNRGTLAVVEAADTPSIAGTVVNRGTLAVVEATDTTSFVGTVIGAGTGVLTPTNSTVASSGLSASTGTGVLTSTTSTVVGSGKSISTGTGVLTSTSTIASSGTVAWRGTGVLTSTNCVSVGLGVSASIGTGTLASTTSTIVSSGTVAWRGTGVLISTSSTIVSLGVATSFATLAVIEAPDIAIFVASGISSGLLTVVEPPDTATFVGKTSSTGTGALTSTSTLAGLGEATSKGALVVSEASDTAVIAGSVFHKATLVATEASDTPVIIGTVVNRGTLAVTEANDNAVLVGTVVNNGTLVATEASDTAVIVGTVVNRGTLAAIEGADIAIFVTAGISSGVLTVVEAADTANFNGTVVNRGTLTVVEAADTPSFAGTVVNRGTLTVVEANDNAVIVGKVVNNGALVALETPDTAVFAGTVLRRVSSAAALFIAA